MQLEYTCNDCPLHEDRNKIIWGEGSTDAPMMMVFESPGEAEDEFGTPLWHETRPGKEYDHMLFANRSSRDLVYTTYLAKCLPYKKCDTSPCHKYLREEISRIKPGVIMAFGTKVTRWFLGEGVSLEMVHGIPFEITFHGHKTVVVPAYHPASGLNKPEFMMRGHYDFKAAFDILRGEIKRYRLNDQYKNCEQYNLVSDPDKVKELLAGENLVAVDTETVAEGAPWSIQLSTHPGHAFMVYAQSDRAIQEVKEHLEKPEVTTIVQNALFDLDIMWKMGIEPARYVDTMVMAYLLQMEPQGLKPLAYRHAGMVMEDYLEVVNRPYQEKAHAYLLSILEYEWPNPDKVLTFKPDGSPHIKQPQNIGKKVKAILKAYEKGNADPRTRWDKIKPEDGRGMVEMCLGIMPEGYLSEIPIEDAIFYACRDADATLRIYPYLLDRIKAYKMEEVLEIDMGAVPMVHDMMQVGIKADPEKFAELSQRFMFRCADLNSKVDVVAGRHINIGSSPQVKQLVYNDLRLGSRRGKQSTEDKYLAKLIADHPVIQNIRDWRSYSKLKGTYADKIPQYIEKDGRVHARFKITRTSTGRLSCADPNLMAQPTRNKDGKEIRDGYVAAPGCLFSASDYSGIEMRVAAHLSEDKELKRIFDNGLDIHSETASLIFGIPVSQVDEMQHRYPAKRVGFGILYDISAQGLREQLILAGMDENKWTISAVEDLIDGWFDAYKGVKEFMRATALHARRYGYVKDMWGRVRFVPQVKAADKWIQARGLRQAGNQPIQSSAQGIIKRAMANLTPVYKSLRKDGYIVNPLIQIHDDLLDEVQVEILDTWLRAKISIMESAATLSVPVPVDCKVGAKWGSMVGYTP